MVLREPAERATAGDRSSFDRVVAAIMEASSRRWLLSAVAVLLAVALAMRTLTAARGLFAPLVVLAATAVAVHYGSRVGVGLAAFGGVVSTVLAYVHEGFRGADLALTALAVPLWMVIVAAIGSFASTVRHRDAALAAHARDLSHRALHDPLTGLPNRTLFFDRLEHALARAKRSGSLTGVLFLDLDGFKAINDRFGHAVGDELLVGVARRLAAQLREMDTAARLGGDEFVVVCEDVATEQEPVNIAMRVAAAVRAPFSVAGQEVTVNASIGVAVATTGDCAPEQLLRSADAAMYEAKRGNTGVCTASP